MRMLLLLLLLRSCCSQRRQRPSRCYAEKRITGSANCSICSSQQHDPPLNRVLSCPQLQSCLHLCKSPRFLRCRSHHKCDHSGSTTGGLALFPCMPDVTETSVSFRGDFMFAECLATTSEPRCEMMAYALRLALYHCHMQYQSTFTGRGEGGGWRA
jgi:hypothetical protein